MLLSVNISDFTFSILGWILTILLTYLNELDNIIILDIDDYSVSLLDFNIALLVIGIVVGAFVHINRADDFYSNRKD